MRHAADFSVWQTQTAHRLLVDHYIYAIHNKMQTFSDFRTDYYQIVRESLYLSSRTIKQTIFLLSSPALGSLKSLNPSDVIEVYMYIYI